MTRSTYVRDRAPYYFRHGGAHVPPVHTSEINRMLTHKSSWTLLATCALMLALPSDARAQAMATCKDGSTSAAGKGACSGHGGVDKKATKAATAAAKPAKAAPKTTAAAKPAATPAPAPAPTPAPKTATAAKVAPVATPAPVAAPTPTTAKAAAPATAAPTTAAKPAATTASKDGPATAKCKDGTMSYSKGHSGACSRHGGVAEWLDGTAKKP